MNTLEPYQQTYTYDTGDNLNFLSHQAHSNTWQQTLAIHPNNNRSTETQQSTTDFDANGNLLTLNNIGTLNWHYNNTLNQLNKQDKNTTEYYVYDYQGSRVRAVIESDNQVQSQKDYLPLLDISTNQAKQTTHTLHIGTHIFSQISKNNTQTCYQLTNHLQSSTLELNDNAQPLSYEHYYPYGGTAIIASKDKTQAQQKRYRYTGKERDDSSGLCYYGARYQAPWLARWISPDSAGAVDGLNLYVYVANNPLKYRDPTGHVKFTFKLENAGKKAVELNVGKYTKISESVPLLNLNMRRIRIIRNEILKSDMFRKLGALKSSAKLYYDNDPCYLEVHKEIEALRDSIKVHVADIEKKYGISNMKAIIQFSVSDEFKDMLFEQYKVANCGEIADVMTGELSKNYPKMTVESIMIRGSNHIFNVLNRNQSTSIFEPKKWNDDFLVIDAWKGNVYTKRMFLLANSPLNFYGLNRRVQGEIKHRIIHNNTISFFKFNGLNIIEEETIL
ncbi:RHS repeat domain-containing protein [bacterium endosymbiont of Bathymodiolus sp. 5 South]|jgi:RHS repeat-associated protein|uniref:RHS repeat domain-containing protein n=1 Tax=bacterium endosymbiont of Bathymodiolus sp. 5 South TaxID=1181670 RepID=UPI0010B4FF7F|nr:RHS repeat-associated core domain-containing protein [bacterium endosymbiont of Bathymodiolus sp. 5 South]SSC08958.1 insecticidal toxin complex protein [bacterium endosymbiont of Bathymodiolus sp. 5 South]VVH63994.1 hypothetical protein BSPWISOX_267 [uncultured Gammaproteobacteria bacterium]VVM27375.1 hypothetical protein BSPWISOXPB_10347 [uncultured Gammaproteobacteria bacterium]